MRRLSRLRCRRDPSGARPHKRAVALGRRFRLGTNLGAVFALNYARDYARGGGDYAEPQYGPPF
jgi:hypothetical protein